MSTHALPLVLLGLLVACGEPENTQRNPVDPTETSDTVTETEAEEDLPSPYVVEEEEGQEPIFGAQEIADFVASSVGDMRYYHAEPMVSAYYEAMEAATPGCPDYYDDGYGSYWYDYCTTNAGVVFEGYGSEYEYDYWDGDTHWVSQEFYAEARIEGDTTFSGAGYGYIAHGESELGWSYISSYNDGSFSWDGAGADGTWMGSDVRPALSVWSAERAENRELGLSGVITGLDGLAAETMALENVYIGVWGSECDAWVQGTFSIRDDDGNWYDLMIDPKAQHPQCERCGDVWFRGEVLGEGCLPLRGLLP